MPPKLRELDVQETPEGLALTDPLGLSEQVLILSPEAYYIATLFDGTRSLEDVQALLLREHGSVVPREKLEELLTALEKARFLEDPKLRELAEERLRAYLREPRPMVLADRSYPRDPEAFRRYVETLRAFHEGEVAPASGGLVMPHLEPARVPELYGVAIEAMRRTPPPDRVVVLGVAHRGVAEVAAAWGTPLETPLGPLPVDLEALQALDALLPFELFNSPLAFREEHSIEFPAVFMKAAWSDAAPRILPLIVSGDPERKAGLDELARALALLAERYPLWPLASVDLSHVGARFGHPPLDRERVTQARSVDRRYLELVAAGAFDAAWASLVPAGNPTYVDAYAAVHAGHRLFAGRGAVLGYALSPEIPTLSAVGAGVIAFSADA